MLVGLAAAASFFGRAAAGPNPCAPHVYAPAGAFERTTVPLHGPGLVLAGGGTDIDQEFTWLHSTLFGASPKTAGNVLVVRAHGDNDYDSYMRSLGPFASVRTIVIPPCATPAQVNSLAHFAGSADAVFFAGGDQANYVSWKDSALLAAVRTLWAKGGGIGGTSAGLAIQGAFAYDSVAADRLHPGDDEYEVRTKNALPDPFESEISFTAGMFTWPPLANVITDTHFARRDRFGRLVAFLARIERERRLPTGTVYGLGVDERSAIVVDRYGIGTLIAYRGSGYRTHGTYLVHLIRVEQLQPGRPLIATVEVLHLAATGARLNLYKKRGQGAVYEVTVNGGDAPPYSRDPY